MIMGPCGTMHGVLCEQRGGEQRARLGRLQIGASTSLESSGTMGGIQAERKDGRL